MLPAVGSPLYLQSLLSYISSHYSLDGFAPDPVLLSATLLTLIVNRGGLIIDLPRHVDLTGERKVVRHLATLSEAVFGRSTHVAPFDDTVGPEKVGSRLLRPSSHEEHHGPDTSRPSMPETVILTGVEKLSGPSILQIADIMVKRSIILPPDSDDPMQVALPDDFLLIWIRRPVEQDYPGWWVDHFAASIVCQSSSLASPSIEAGDIVPDVADQISSFRSLLDFTHIHPPLQVHISNLLSAVSTHPQLLPTFTGRAVRLFPAFVAAHRLLSAPFGLPAGWEKAIGRRDDPSTCTLGKFGVGGGCGGVDTWARLAGEEPTVADLAGGRQYDDVGWFASLNDVRGVWQLCVRHRVKMRKPKGEIMWLLQSAAGNEQENDRSEDAGLRVERILDNILQTV